MIWLQLVHFVCSDKKQSSDSFRVAIVNFAQFHHEVFPAFHYAFQSAGCNVTTFASKDGYNMRGATNSWRYDTHNVSGLSDAFCDYDIFVFTTVESTEDFRYSVISENYHFYYYF